MSGDRCEHGVPLVSTIDGPSSYCAECEGGSRRLTHEKATRPLGPTEMSLLAAAIAEANACGHCTGECGSCQEEAAHLAGTVSAIITARLDAAAVRIEQAFRDWDALGPPHAPHPVNSAGWLIERAYASAATIVRAPFHEGDE